MRLVSFAQPRNCVDCFPSEQRLVTHSAPFAFTRTEQEDKEVVFTCTAESDHDDDTTHSHEIDDEIEFTVSANEGLKVKVKYEQELETNNSTEVEKETSYTVTFVKMVEYSKVGNNTDMAYDWDTDAVVQTVPLNAFNLTDIETDSNGIVSKFNATSPDGRMTFTFTISRAASGEKLTANKMKIDFELMNFPWVRSDTFVALVCDIDSEQEIEVNTDDDDDDDDDDGDDDDDTDGVDIEVDTEGEDNEVEGTEGEDRKLMVASSKAKDVRISFAQAVKTIGLTPFGAYTWAETAQVRTPANGTTATSRNTDETIAVVATKPVDATNNSIAFSFVGDAAKSAMDIYWDPEAGIEYDVDTDFDDDSDSSAFRTIRSSVLFIVVSVGAILAM